jgi:hypothetical protein
MSASIDLEAEKANIMSAINLLGSIEAQAYFDLDPTPLSNIFSGEALKAVTTNIDNLKKNNLYQVSIRNDIRFGEITLSPDNTQAEARVIPTWELSIYSSTTKQCVGYLPPTEQPQTIYLEKTSSGWIAYTISFDNKQSAPWQECPE